MPLPSLSRADTNSLTAYPLFVQYLKEIKNFPECLFFECWFAQAVDNACTNDFK